MAAYNKFQDYVEQLNKGVHNWSSHTFKAAFSNSAPSATNTQLSDITQISTGGGYTAGAGGGVRAARSARGETNRITAANGPGPRPRANVASGSGSRASTWARGRTAAAGGKGACMRSSPCRDATAHRRTGARLLTFQPQPSSGIRLVKFVSRAISTA